VLTLSFSRNLKSDKKKLNSDVNFSAITRKITPGQAKYMGRGFEIFKPADIVSRGGHFCYWALSGIIIIFPRFVQYLAIQRRVPHIQVLTH